MLILFKNIFRVKPAAEIYIYKKKKKENLCIYREVITLKTTKNKQEQHYTTISLYLWLFHASPQIPRLYLFPR